MPLKRTGTVISPKISGDTIEISYGSTADTACEGNDSRLLNADQKAALDGANSPSTLNVLATVSDITQVSGGSPTVIYLDDTVVYDGYGTLDKTATLGTLVETNVTVDADVNGGVGFARGFFYDTILNRTSWPSGEWFWNFYCRVSSAVGVSTILAAVYVVPETVGGSTVTMTGTGTSRTATITGATPFVVGDANADETVAGYLQTASGTFQIIGFTSTSVVTIATEVGHVNETAVTYTAHKFQFIEESDEIDNAELSDTPYPKRFVEPEISLNYTDKFAIRVYGKTTSTSPRTIYFSYNDSEHYSTFRMPIFPIHNDLDGLNVGDYQHTTGDQKDALDGANTPSVTNVFATILDITTATIDGGSY